MSDSLQMCFFQLGTTLIYLSSCSYLCDILHANVNAELISRRSPIERPICCKNKPMLVNRTDSDKVQNKIQIKSIDVIKNTVFVKNSAIPKINTNISSSGMGCIKAGSITKTVLIPARSISIKYQVRT